MCDKGVWLFYRDRKCAMALNTDGLLLITMHQAAAPNVVSAGFNCCLQNRPVWRELICVART